jgi:hypothetical protein
MFAWPVAGNAQVAVPEIEELDEYPTISETEISELIGPIALYPDDLLAIVLPASTYPLQIVEAGRFLEDLEDDPTLQPDEDWDDSIVALLNYPEVVELLNEDLDWTWRLGEAVVGQQSDVIAAIEDFRDRAYAAGNLKSDDYQLVAQEEGTIQISPVQEDVIYVPYYEPEQVVVYQPRPVYYYHPRPYPVYYYPYPSYYSFHNHFYNDFFWGVTTAYAIGWHSYHLNVFHHSYYGHPYYGRSYRDRYWYRRPDIHVYNTTYARNNISVSRNRYRDGDQWAPRNRRSMRGSDQRITRTRTRTYATSNTRPSTSTISTSTSSTDRSGRPARNRTSNDVKRQVQRRSEPDAIEFRDRTPSRTANPVRTTSTRKSSSPPPRRSSPSNVARNRPERSTVAPSSSRPKSVSTPKPQRSSQAGSSQARSSQPRSSQPRSSQARSSQTRSSRSSSSQSRSPKSSQSNRRSSSKKSTRSSNQDR